LSKNKNTPSPADDDVEVVVTQVVASTPSNAIMSGPQVDALPADASNDDRIAHARERLMALAEGSEFEEALFEIASNMAPNIKGLEGAGGVSVPVIAMRQKATGEETVPEGTKLGEFYTKQGDRFGSSIKLIPIRSTYKRTKFVKGQQKPDCTSDDGVTGSKYGQCKGCVWARYEAGQTTPCQGGWSFQGVLEGFENSKIYQIDFMKTSSATGKKLRTLAIPPALYAIVVEVYTEKAMNANKEEYYVLKVRATGRKTEGVTRQAADAICDFLTARAANFHDRREANQANKALGSGGSAPALGAGDVPAEADENPDLGGEM
jgi:hypothetical protein